MLQHYKYELFFLKFNFVCFCFSSFFSLLFPLSVGLCPFPCPPIVYIETNRCCYFTKWALDQMGIGPNGHWAKWGLGQMGIGPNGYWTEWGLDQMGIGPNGHCTKWVLDQICLDQLGLDEMGIGRNGCRRNDNLPNWF